MTEDGERSDDGADRDDERPASSNADEERSSSDGAERDPEGPPPGESERAGARSSRGVDVDQVTGDAGDPPSRDRGVAQDGADDGSHGAEDLGRSGTDAAVDPEGGDVDREDDGSRDDRQPGPDEPSGGDEGEGRYGDPTADGERVVDGARAGGEVAAGIGATVDGRAGGGDEPGAGAAQGERPPGVAAAVDEPDDDVPPDVRSYDRFQKVDRASYDRVNEFLRDRTYITAREWAIARLCADFRTATGVEMTKIGENLPHLVPFMTDTYSPQAVNQARSAFEEKVRMSGATFLYGAMSGFFTADELDEIMYEVTEVAKFLLEVEGVELAVDEELDSEDQISAVMREVRRASAELRHDGVECPECGHRLHQPGAEDDLE